MAVWIKESDNSLIQTVKWSALSGLCQNLSVVFWQTSYGVLSVQREKLYLHSVIVRAEALEGSTVECLLMVRVCYADEQLGTFLH